MSKVPEKDDMRRIEIPLTRGPFSDEVAKSLTDAGLDVKGVEADRRRLLDEREVRKRIFTTLGLAMALDLKTLDELRDLGFTGAFLHSKEGPQASAVGEKMDLLEVKFYRIRDERWKLPGGTQQCFPLREGVVPVIGGIRVGSRVLSDEELEKYGWQAIRDDEGKPVKYKIFAGGGRSAVIGGQFSVPVVREGKGFKLLESDGELMQLGLRELGLKGIKAIEAECLSVIKVSYEKARTSGATDLPPPKEFMDVHHDEVFYAFIAEALVNKKVLEKKDVVAVQLKGLGGRYKLHLAKQLGEGEVELDLGDKDAKRVGLKYVKRLELEGYDGIILDFSYLPDMTRPVGGASTRERLERKHDRILALNGAVLSGMTIGNVKLLDDKQVPELCTTEIGITAKIIFDDTRRAGLFVMDPEKGPFNYRQYLRERYGNWEPEASLEAERDDHLKFFCRNLGINMKAILDSGFNIPADQMIVWNISTEGGLVDTADLSDLKNPQHAMSLCVGMLRTIDDVCHWTSLGSVKFFRSEYFRRFVSSFLGEKEADAMMNTAAKELTEKGYEDEDHQNRVLIKLGGMLTDMWLKSKGYDYKSVWQMWDSQVLKKLENEPRLREEVGLTANMLKDIKKIQNKPAGSMITMEDGHKRTRTVSLQEAVDSFRLKIDQVERYLAGPDVRETYFSRQQQEEG